MKKIILCILFYILSVCTPLYAAQNQEPLKNATYGREGAFNLLNVADNFIKAISDTQGGIEATSSKNECQKMFTSSVDKFLQGNVTTAYNDFAYILERINNDFAYISLAYNFDNIGLFSLADSSLAKIQNKALFKAQIDNLNELYAPKYQLTRDEEIFLAKSYTSIYFDNSAHEAAFDLNKKTSLLEKSDYANYLLAQALVNTKEFSNALTYIDYAINKNPKNISYKYYKSEILINLDKNKEALKEIDELQNLKINSFNYDNKIQAQRELILSNLEKNQTKKDFYLAKHYFYLEDYSHAIKKCQDVVSNDKKAYWAQALLGDCYVKNDNIAKAQKSYNQSYALNKKYAPTLIGLGDLVYIHERYDEAQNYYIAALKFDKENIGAKIKLASLYKQKGEIDKFNQINSSYSQDNPLTYGIYYAVSRINPNLGDEYLKKAIALNPLYVEAWLELARVAIQNNKPESAKNYLYPVSFVSDEQYLYYFYSGLADIMLNDHLSASMNFKKSLKLNPNFSQAKYELSKINDL